MILETIEKEHDLLTNEGYFERYRDHLAESASCRIAWAKTEADLSAVFGGRLRRFMSHKAFQNALKIEQKRRASGEKLAQKVTFSTVR